MNTLEAKTFVTNVLEKFKDTPDSQEKAVALNAELEYCFNYFRSIGYTILNSGGVLVGVTAEYNPLDEKIRPLYCYQGQ